MKVTRAVHQATVDHIKKWESCEACRYRSLASQVLFFEGSLPADVLFLGKSPDMSSDVRGTPFVIRSDPFWHIANGLDAIGVRWCAAYAVSCGPIDEKGLDRACGAKCSAKLVELVAICRPKLIVPMGEAPYMHCVIHRSTLTPASGNNLIIVKLPDMGWIAKQEDPDQHIESALSLLRSSIEKYHVTRSKQAPSPPA